MIIGFSFNKIAVERAHAANGKISVKHDLRLNTLTERTLVLHDNKKGITFNFDFTVTYEPKMASLAINGDVMYLNSEKKLKDIMNTWNTHKKVPPDVSFEVLNTILSRCTIKALELAEDLNLPSHIPLPKISLERENYSSYIG